MDDIYTRFNRKHIDDRQIDTLIGLSKGVLADNEVNEQEARFLQTWLVQARHASRNPIMGNLLARVSEMLEDGVLDDDEERELVGILRGITGEQVALGELARPTTLPLDRPAPEIMFPGKRFLFTGTCVYGSRSACREAVTGLGGSCASSVSKHVDYVVIGTYVTDSWMHESFGRKIEQAMNYRARGVPLAIVTEEHWANQANL